MSARRRPARTPPAAGAGRLTWPLIPQACVPRSRAPPAAPIGLWVGASQKEPPRSPPRPPGRAPRTGRRTDARTDGRVDESPGRAGRDGGGNFLLGTCPTSPPGRPLPQVPRPGTEARGRARSPPANRVGPENPRREAGGQVGASARLGSGEPSRLCAPARRTETPGEHGARFLCAARKTAGTPGAKPTPPERRAWVPFCTPWSVSGSEKAKTSEAVSSQAGLDFGLEGLGVEPGGGSSAFPGREQRTGN